jgi:hypothetical protein
MFLYFAFSIGIEMDFTAVYYLLTSILILMTTKVNNMTTTINMTNVFSFSKFHYFKEHYKDIENILNYQIFCNLFFVVRTGFEPVREFGYYLVSIKAPRHTLISFPCEDIVYQFRHLTILISLFQRTLQRY